MAVHKQFNSFAELIEGATEPILIDFYAPWCGPCQLMAKVLEQVGSQVRGKAQIAKINTDIYPQIAEQYQVHALPTLILFKNGQAVDRIEGVITAEQLYGRMARHF
jgi:thioredoxin